MLLVPAISTCHSFGSIVLGMGENPLEKAGAFLRMPSKLRMASKITKHFDKLTVFPVTFVRLSKSCHDVLFIGFLVHPPDVSMVDGENHEAVWIFL